MILNHNRTTSIRSNLNSTTSNQQITMKDSLSYQIESALKEYESLQNQLSSIKGKSYTNVQTQSPYVSSPKTVNNIKTPQDSRTILPQVNQKESNTSSSKNIMNEFKTILYESELAISNKYPKNIPQQSKLNSSYHTGQRQQHQDLLTTQCEVIKISNQVLNKSNLDLKNLNHVYEIELNSYKNKSSAMPFSQYDNNVNVFIDTLKTSLNTSQMSNRELNDIFILLREENVRLSTNNQKITDQMSKFQKENDETYDKNKDISTINSNLIRQCSEIDNENKMIIKEIEEYKEKINDQQSKNSNLNKVNESYATLQYNNEEILNQLKSTIDGLKKKSEESSKEKDDNVKQLLFINNELRSREEDIKELKEKLHKVQERQNDLKGLDRSYYDKVSAKNSEIFNYNMTLKNVQNDIEKMKSNNKVLFQIIEDREKTILNLDESLKFLNTKISLESNDNQRNPNELGNENKENELNDLLDELGNKEYQISEIRKNYEEIIKLKNDKIAVLTQKKNFNDNSPKELFIE